jgi:hypothetical protein
MRRPRGADRSWYWRLSREYRRIHHDCCIGDLYTCPVCGALDNACNDLCRCYAKDPDLWRKMSWARMVKRDPELGEHYEESNQD